MDAEQARRSTRIFPRRSSSSEAYERCHNTPSQHIVGMENSNRANRAGSVNYHVITSCPAVEDV